MVAWALAAAVAVLGLSLPAQAGIQSAVGGESSVPLGRTCRNFFRVLPYLTHVTSTAIRVNMVPDDAFDLRVSVSPASATTWGISGIVTQAAAAADTRTHLVAAPNATITGLTAGTQYRYLVECRTDAASPYLKVQQAYFRTLQTDAAATVRIALMADSHVSETVVHYLRDRLISTVNPQSLQGMYRTVRQNMATRPFDFIVDGGDSAVPHCVTCNTAYTYTRENGDAVSITTGDADDQAEVNARWEMFLTSFQPVLAYAPLFMAMGNHEEIQHYGGLADDQATCTISQNETIRALAGYQAMMGNLNDTYPADTGDMDLDGNPEVQNDGLYYEFASGSLRWFIVDNLYYGNDTANLGATPASQFAGFVARVADQPTASFGNCPDPGWPADGTDTYEDNTTLGGEQTAWLIARSAAKAEAFGAIISHRITGGVSGPANYYYQRGLVATGDSDADGRIEVTDNFDADLDGDLADEHYINTLMAAEAIQLRFVAHDHEHLICRKNTRHYIQLGRPLCSNFSAGGTCFSTWFSPSGTGTVPFLRDMADCDEDLALDFDPYGTLNGTNARAVANNGISGTNGSLNPGYGYLTVDGANSMQWQWVVTDEIDKARNNDPIVTYGPILP